MYRIGAKVKGGQGAHRKAIEEHLTQSRKVSESFLDKVLYKLRSQA